jgi:hypothetical protein
VYLSGNRCRVFLHGDAMSAIAVHGPHVVCEGSPPCWPAWCPGDMLCDLMW